jgi:hypothetical protein
MRNGLMQDALYCFDRHKHHSTIAKDKQNGLADFLEQMTPGERIAFYEHSAGTRDLWSEVGGDPREKPKSAGISEMMADALEDLTRDLPMADLQITDERVMTLLVREGFIAPVDNRFVVLPKGTEAGLAPRPDVQLPATLPFPDRESCQ